MYTCTYGWVQTWQGKWSVNNICLFINTVIWTADRLTVPNFTENNHTSVWVFQYIPLFRVKLWLGLGPVKVLLWFIKTDTQIDITLSCYWKVTWQSTYCTQRWMLSMINLRQGQTKFTTLYRGNIFQSPEFAKIPVGNTLILGHGWISSKHTSQGKPLYQKSARSVQPLQQSTSCDWWTD